MKHHLIDNLYFDTSTGRFLELTRSDKAVLSEDCGDGTGYATFGCLKDDNGTLLSAAVYPSTITCGDDRAHGKRVGSVTEMKALFCA